MFKCFDTSFDATAAANVRSFLCIGGDCHEGGDVEFSRQSSLSTLSTITTFGRSQSRQKEVQELLAAQRLVIREDEAGTDIHHKQLDVEKNITTKDEAVSIYQVAEDEEEEISFVMDMSRREAVFTAIDHLEKALGGVNKDDKDATDCGTSRYSSDYCQRDDPCPEDDATRSNDGTKSVPGIKSPQRRFLRQGILTGKLQSAIPREMADSPHQKTKLSTYLFSNMSCLLSPSRSRQKKSGEKAMLLPRTKSNDYFLFDNVDKSPTEVPDKKKTRNNDGSARHFLRRLIPKGRTKKTKHTSIDPIPDIIKNDTRSLSLESENDKEFAKQPIFNSDEELVDHLVRHCEEHSPLEADFHCLQERIRSRSFGSRKSVATSSSQGDSNSPSHSVAGPNFVDSCKFEHRKSSSATNVTVATTVATDGALMGVSLSFSPGGDLPADPQNDTIPSFTSLEDVTTSPLNDSAYSATLEAILFEQELEKLTTDELAELLDAELEKLMQEGLLTS